MSREARDISRCPPGEGGGEKARSSASRQSERREQVATFGLLTGTYNLMYSFALDLNQPFDGVYQVRRSAAATSLLGARLLLDKELPDGLAVERGEFSPADPRPC